LHERTSIEPRCPRGHRGVPKPGAHGRSPVIGNPPVLRCSEQPPCHVSVRAVDVALLDRGPFEDSVSPVGLVGETKSCHEP